MNTSRAITIQTGVTYASIGFIILSVVAYLYFLNISVVHVVMRKEAAQEVSHLKTEIAVLETAYIEAQHKIANQVALLDGYKEDGEKIFVTRSKDTSLVLRDN